MKNAAKIIGRAFTVLAFFMVLCGLAYTLVITGAAQILFPAQANGSVVEVDGKTYPCSYVELGYPGLPHAVVPIPGLRGRPEAELFALGRKLRAHPAFPKGANVNFFDVEGPGRIWERTFERGVEGFTYACGTGTGSVAAVLTLQGAVSGRAVAVQMTGGELVVDVERRGSTVEHLFLTGPTNMVAKGELTDEELPL